MVYVHADTRACLLFLVQNCSRAVPLSLPCVPHTLLCAGPPAHSISAAKPRNALGHLLGISVLPLEQNDFGGWSPQIFELESNRLLLL